MNPAARAVLTPLSWLYGGAMRLRNRFYERSSAVRRASVPVVSVGNLTLGGTGKTPIVDWLARRLRSGGHRPAVVSRGYGGSSGRGPTLVSRGDGPLCGPDRCGDEPYLLATRLEAVPVIVGSDRWAAAQIAEAVGCDVVLMDDGFQHRRLARDLDVLLLDAGNPFGDYRVIPAGRLREPLVALRRAGVVLITRAVAGGKYPEIEQTLRRHGSPAPVLLAGHRPVGFFDIRGERFEKPERAVAFCGIGTPQRFRDDLAGLGVDVVGFHAYRDHHVYVAEQIGRLQAEASSCDAPLITTEKDLARLQVPELRQLADSILALRIEAVIHEPGPLLRAVEGLPWSRSP